MAMEIGETECHLVSKWSSLHDAVIHNDQLTDEQNESFKQMLKDLSTNVVQSVAETSKIKNRDVKLVQLTILQNFLQKVSTNQAFQDIGEQVITMDTAEALRSLLNEEDEIQGHLVAKCIPLLFLQPHLVDNVGGTVSHLVESLVMMNPESCQARHYIQVLLNVFSRKLWESGKDQQPLPQLQDLQLRTFTATMKYWDCISNLYISAQNQEISKHNNFMSFLSLWKKLIKFTKTPEFELEDEDLEDLVENGFLLEKMEKLIPTRGSKLPAMVSIKILDLLNHGLPYGVMVSRRDPFDIIHQTLAITIITRVNSGLLDKLPKYRKGTVGFGGESFEQEDKCESKSHTEVVADHRIIRKMALLVLRACAVLVKTGNIEKDDPQVAAVSSCLISTWQWVQGEGHTSLATSSGHWLIATFCDQDDSLVEAMLCLLDIFTTSKYGNISLGPDEVWKLVEPHQVFLSFLDNMSHDHTVLIDLLASPETCFLLYFIKYLHHTVNKWDDLSEACLKHSSQKKQVDVVTMEPMDTSPADGGSDNVLDQLNEEISENDKMTEELRDRLAEMLRRVSSERMRATQVDTLKDVSTSLHKLRHKNKIMEEVLKTTEMLVPSGANGSSSENVVKDKDAVVTTKDQSLARSTDTLFPTLTEYSDSDSDGEDMNVEEKSRMDLIQDCSRYLDTVTERAALMSLVGQSRMPQTNKTKLTDYSDSESDEEKDNSESGIQKSLQMFGTQNEQKAQKSNGHQMAINSNGHQVAINSDDHQVAQSSFEFPASQAGNDGNIFKTPFPPPPTSPGRPADSSAMKLIGQTYGTESSELDNAMSVLIRLRYALEKLTDKGLFPYNSLPLIKLLGQCEALYEQ